MAEKSRLAEILGVEEDEEFTVNGFVPVYRIHNGKREYEYHGKWLHCNTEADLIELINNPSLIQHKPRFTDEEMTVLRWLHKYGKFKRFYKTIDGRVSAFGISSLAGNIADYLLKPGEAIDLDELFKEDEDG